MISISLISKSIEADTKKLIENISSNPDKEQELVDQFISETNRKIGRQLNIPVLVSVLSGG